MTSVSDAIAAGSSSRYRSGTPPPIPQPTRCTVVKVHCGHQGGEVVGVVGQPGVASTGSGSVLPKARSFRPSARNGCGNASIVVCQNRFGDTLPLDEQHRCPGAALDRQHVDGQPTGVEFCDHAGRPGGQSLCRRALGAPFGASGCADRPLATGRTRPGCRRSPARCRHHVRPQCPTGRPRGRRQVRDRE